MSIGSILYELDSELRVAFIQIEEADAPEEMTAVFISMCSVVKTANQIIEPESLNMVESFYGCKEPDYHPLLERLYIDYFASLDSEILDQSYFDSEFNTCCT